MVWAREPLEGRGQLQWTLGAAEERLCFQWSCPLQGLFSALACPSLGASPTVGTLPLGVLPWTSCGAARGLTSQFFTD